MCVFARVYVKLCSRVRAYIRMSVFLRECTCVCGHAFTLMCSSSARVRAFADECVRLCTVAGDC